MKSTGKDGLFERLSDEKLEHVSGGFGRGKEKAVCPDCKRTDVRLVGSGPVKMWECKRCGRKWSEYASVMA